MNLTFFESLMQGHGFFIAGAYLAGLILLVFEIWGLRRRRVEAAHELFIEARSRRSSMEIK